MIKLHNNDIIIIIKLNNKVDSLASLAAVRVLANPPPIKVKLQIINKY